MARREGPPVKPTRRLAREIALQLLFEAEANPDIPPERRSAYASERLGFPKLERFTLDLVEGVIARQTELDAALALGADNWSVERMGRVDRAILRLGAYELRHAGTPPAVAINEALELCKKYSAPEGVAFVNGVLDRVAGGRGQARDDLPPPAAEPEA